jgi:hypothetical protein
MSNGVAQGKKAPSASLIDPRVTRLIELNEKIKADEAALNKLKKEEESLNFEVQNLFIDAETQSLNVKGLCVYLRRELRANVKPDKKEECKEVLRSMDLENFINERIETSRLAAYVRELERNGEPVPEALSECINTAEIFDIRIIKGTKKGALKHGQQDSDSDEGNGSEGLDEAY